LKRVIILVYDGEEIILIYKFSDYFWNHFMYILLLVMFFY